jgi:hypothetical protein
MAKLNFGLGGFAGQLSAEELANAYAMAGGRPEELQLGLPPAPPPAPVQSLPPPVAAPAGPVTAARGGPGQQIKQYDADLLGTANQRIDLAGQQGREESATFERRAGLRGEQATRARAELDDAKGRVEEGRGREREKRDEADRLYEELKANAKPPGKKGIEQVMGIIGSVMAMGGGNRGMAQGASMLGSLLGSDREGWAAEQQSNSNLYRSALAGIDSERGGQSHDLDIASRIAALDAHYYDAALEQAKEMGLSEEAKRVATGLQLDMRDKATSLLRNNAVLAQQKALTGAKTAAEDYFYRVPLEQLRQMPSQVLGKIGSSVLAERTKRDQGYREGEADIRKKEAGASGEAGQKILPGIVATIPLEKKDVSDIHANAQALTAIKENYRKLAEIRKRHAGKLPDPGTYKQDSDLAGNIISELTGTMNQMAGRGAPSEGERADMIKQLQDPTGVYVFGDPAATYAAQVKRLENNFLAGLEAVGAAREDGSPLRTGQSFQGGAGGGMASGQQSALGAGTGETVTMLRPGDNKPFKVHRSQVQKMREQGWSDESVAGGSFIAQPADLFAQGGGQ